MDLHGQTEKRQVDAVRRPSRREHLGVLPLSSPPQRAYPRIIFTLKQECSPSAPVTSDYIGDIFLGCYVQKVCPPPAPTPAALIFQ